MVQYLYFPFRKSSPFPIFSLPFPSLFIYPALFFPTPFSIFTFIFSRLLFYRFPFYSPTFFSFPTTSILSYLSTATGILPTLFLFQLSFSSFFTSPHQPHPFKYFQYLSLLFSSPLPFLIPLPLSSFLIFTFFFT